MYKIRHQERKYNHYKKRMDAIKEEERIDEINQIRYFLTNNRINCFKYNYAFEEVVQNFNSYQSFIQLSPDGTELVITNRKPREKLEYLHQEDPDLIDEMRDFYRNKKRRESKLADVNKDYLPTEIDEELDELEFADIKSSASCFLEDIQGFVYGGVTSRFWVHRKHINALAPDKIDLLPFNSWNCITLQLKHRDVDLVIRSQTQMNMFLKFLIYSLQTFDGKRGTAKPLIRALCRQEIRKLKSEQGRQVISDSKK